MAQGLVCLLILALAGATAIDRRIKFRARKVLAHTTSDPCQFPIPGNANCVNAREGVAKATAVGDQYIDTGGVDSCIVIVGCSLAGANVAHYPVQLENTLEERRLTPDKWAETSAFVVAANYRVLILGNVGAWRFPDAGHPLPYVVEKAYDQAGQGLQALDWVIATNARMIARELTMYVGLLDRMGVDYRIFPDCRVAIKPSANPVWEAAEALPVFNVAGLAPGEIPVEEPEPVLHGPVHEPPVPPHAPPHEPPLPPHVPPPEPEPVHEHPAPLAPDVAVHTK